MSNKPGGVMGRPPVAYGIWPDMIAAAGGPAAFCSETGIPPRTASRIWQGQVRPRLAHREACLAFAQRHAVRSRAFVAPDGPGFLVSCPDGWFRVQDAPGAWNYRVSARRASNWGLLGDLELDWALFWRRVG